MCTLDRIVSARREIRDVSGRSMCIEGESMLSMTAKTVTIKAFETSDTQSNKRMHQRRASRQFPPYNPLRDVLVYIQAPREEDGS